MATPGIRKPENFTGEKPEEFPIWLAKFEAIAKAGSWDTADKKLTTLPACLSEQAFQFYNKLEATDKADYTLLVKALEKKMGIGEKTMTWKVQLRRAQREPNETIDRYVFRLHNLAKQAYPTASEAERATHVNEQFILGLSSDLQFHLLKSGADSTLDENLKLVKLYEAATDLAGKRKMISTAKVTDEEAAEPAIDTSDYSKLCTELQAMKATMQEMHDTTVNLGKLTRAGATGTPAYRAKDVTSNRCFACGQGGHYARECPQRSPKPKEVECYKCHQLGHISRNCPTPQISNYETRTKSLICSRCKNRGHSAIACRTDLRKECRNCGKKGHMTESCRIRVNPGGYEATKNDTAPAAVGAIGWA